MGLGMLPVIKEVTLTLDTGAYADGDVMAATQEVANAVRQKGGRAVLQSVVVLDKDDQGKDFDLLILRTNVSIFQLCADLAQCHNSVPLHIPALVLESSDE